MKILKKSIVAKNGEGNVRLQADEQEDMYHLYNLITENDLVLASTVRNVVKESKTGSVDKSRVRMQLKIRVERVEFDAEQCSLRLCGRNTEENEHVKMGQYHTIDLELGHSFTIEKERWDQIYLDKLDEACDPSAKAEIAAVVMQEGLAHVCLITSSLTVTRSRIERRMPKKKPGDSSFEKSMARFFADILEAVRKHVNFEIVKAVLIGSPGFLKDDFVKYMMDTATRQGDSALLKQRPKIITTHSTSGYKKAIDDLLGNPDLQGRLLDVRAADEVRALRTFYDTLSVDENRATYGLLHVMRAHEHLAIAELLVTDKLFKSADFNARQRYVALTESVRAGGGKVFVFSSMHVSGEQLDSYTGIAATLRFPLPEVAECGAFSTVFSKCSVAGAVKSFESDSDDEGDGVDVCKEDAGKSGIDTSSRELEGISDFLG